MATYKTSTVIAAAAAAYRINGNKIIKEAKDDLNSNRVIVDAILSNDERFTVTPEDEASAETIIADLEQRATLATLKGQPLNEFTSNLISIIREATVKRSLVGIALWAPMLYENMQRNDDTQHQLSMLAFTSRYIGSVGDRVEIDFETVIVRWHKEFMCWKYTGHDTDGNLIGFFSKTKLSEGRVRIKARIKNTDQNRQSNGKTTYLNYVKELKNVG